MCRYVHFHLDVAQANQSILWLFQEKLVGNVQFPIGQEAAQQEPTAVMVSRRGSEQPGRAAPITTCTAFCQLHFFFRYKSQLMDLCRKIKLGMGHVTRTFYSFDDK